jgi:hypothetical protein
MLIISKEGGLVAPFRLADPVPAGGLGVRIPPGHSDLVTIQFESAQPGYFEGALVVDSNGGDLDLYVTATATGAGP